MKKNAPLLAFLSSPRMVAWLLPWLMLLLVVGTIAQREIGLFEAERRYFASWIVWFGFVPLAGLYPCLLLLSAGLMTKLWLKSPWRRERIGSIVTHLGVLLLLLGGVFTALSAEEGYIVLAEGESTRTLSDYHQRELVIEKNGEAILRLPHSSLSTGMAIENAALPFSLRLALYCRNCAPERLEAAPENTQGLAQKLNLKDAPLAKEDENNMAGVLVEIKGAGGEQDGTYLLYEPTPHRPELFIGEDSYRLLLRKAERPLPFSVQMDAFRTERHLGSDIASEYESLVTIDEGDGIVWQQAIRMNEPLRVRGYTLYQSEVADERGTIKSVLAVVKNEGRISPYLSGIMIGIGILLHLALRGKPKAIRYG